MSRGIGSWIGAAIVITPLVGCSGGTDPERGCVLPGDERVEDEVLLWTGYSYDWLYLSHRIAYMRAGVAQASEEEPGRALFGLIGGDWSTGDSFSDYPWYSVGYQRLAAAGLRAVTGKQAFALGPEAAEQAVVTVDLQEAGLAGATTFALALQGVCLDTEQPYAPGYSGPYEQKWGWTPREFGARLGELQDDGAGTLSFDVEAVFRPGALDRVNHNEALPYARVAAEVGWVLIALDGAEVESRRHRTAAFYKARSESYTDIPMLPEDDRVLHLPGRAGMPVGLPLLQGWSFELNRTTDPETPGRYLRGWHAAVEDFGYDAESGAGELLVDGWLSHSSMIQEGDLEVEFEADFGLLQLADSDADVEMGQAWHSADELGPVEAPID